MEIHLRAIVSKRQPHCWFNTWDLSQIVHSFETILAMVFNKRSTIDMKSLEKVQLYVHNTQWYLIDVIIVYRSIVSCVILLVQCLQFHCVVRKMLSMFKILCIFVALSVSADYKISVSTMDCLCWIVSLPWEEVRKRNHVYNDYVTISGKTDLLPICKYWEKSVLNISSVAAR